MCVSVVLLLNFPVSWLPFSCLINVIRRKITTTKHVRANKWTSAINYMCDECACLRSSNGQTSSIFKSIYLCPIKFHVKLCARNFFFFSSSSIYTRTHRERERGANETWCTKNQTKYKYLRTHIKKCILLSIDRERERECVRAPSQFKRNTLADLLWYFASINSYKKRKN